MESREIYILAFVGMASLLSFIVIGGVLLWLNWSNGKQLFLHSGVVWLTWWITAIFTFILVSNSGIPNPLAYTQFREFGILPIMIFTTTGGISAVLSFINHRKFQTKMKLSFYTELPDYEKPSEIWWTSLTVSLLTSLFVVIFLKFGNFLIFNYLVISESAGC